MFFLEKETENAAIYNVNTSNFTVKEIIDSIRKYIDDIEIDLVDSKIMNQLSYLVLNKKMKDFGFSFEGSLDQGILDTINWFRQA